MSPKLAQVLFTVNCKDLGRKKPVVPDYQIDCSQTGCYRSAAIII